MRAVHVETICSPYRYSWAQLDLACALARMINRGRFVLCIEPEAAQ